ncbi:MAG TPA: alkaline phosphatase family protein [Candidatus Sumerlaeota bacterium]|nr:alkaline phosphatase family protein [Candidatus Sumerlaeota bacterium]HRR30178.1 alkaline phosphatase family protein [Candidatus Sumerlaeia bacterium]
MALNQNPASPALSASTVLFIVADAFRYDYFTPPNTPTMWRLAESGLYVRRLRPNFGFCERAETFTGTRPDANGFFTALTYDETNSEFLSFKKDIWLLSLFDWRAEFMRRYIRRFYRDWFKKVRRVNQPVYEIPLKILPRIALTEDLRDLHQPNWSNIETIFDVMRESGKTFYYDTFASLTMPMGGDDDRVNQICRAFQETPRDFYLLYIGEGDGTGHDYGPESVQTAAMTRRVDKRIKIVSDAFFEAFPDGRMLIIGDHGMLEVAGILDAQSKILRTGRKAGLRAGRDFDYFLDSTLVRLWFRTEKSGDIFRDLFNTDAAFCNEGHVMTCEEAARLHVPPPDGRYGDLIWIAHPGALIFPDFFHFRKICRGMHGYETHIPAQQGFALAVGRDIEQAEIQEAELIDICPTICSLLGIRTPKQNAGKSLL